MTRIVTLNINGIRAGIRKGFSEMLLSELPDIVCLQETKANNETLLPIAKTFIPYHTYMHSAEKKGYSGVAILSLQEPLKIIEGIGAEKFDVEGRYLLVEYAAFRLICVYMPSGTQGGLRQTFKEEFMDYFYDHISTLLESSKPLIIAGDFNICHQAIDIHNPVSNKKSSGFLPHERAWFSKLLELGLLDSFRELNKAPDHYTWWTYRAGARAKNKGWRIDYQLITTDLKPMVISHCIRNECMFSDHCPTEMVLDVEI